VTAIQGTAPPIRARCTSTGGFHQVLEVEPTISGSVPQDDLVLAELTVEETLRAAARLRFGTDEAALENAVESVLRELDIQRIRKSRVGDALRRGISGGQRKRVSLGQELLGRSTRLRSSTSRRAALIRKRRRTSSSSCGGSPTTAESSCSSRTI
jgi:ABC-type Mn2+/Zn2+ transport system ATPase subunit